MGRLLKGALQQRDGDRHCSFVSENRLCQDKKNDSLYEYFPPLDFWLDAYHYEKVPWNVSFRSVGSGTRTLKKTSTVHINKQKDKNFTPSHNSECFLSFTVPPTSSLFSSPPSLFSPSPSRFSHAFQAHFSSSTRLNLLFLVCPFLSLSLPGLDILTASFLSPLSLYSPSQSFPLWQNPCWGRVNCWLLGIMYCISLSYLSFFTISLFLPHEFFECGDLNKTVAQTPTKYKDSFFKDENCFRIDVGHSYNLKGCFIKYSKITTKIMFTTAEAENRNADFKKKNLSYVNLCVIRI